MREEIEKNEVIVYEEDNICFDDAIYKGNGFVSAKYRTNITEAKILYAVLYAIQHREMEETPEGYCVRIPATELKRLIKSNSGSFYDILDNAAEQLMHRIIAIKDREHQYFRYVNLFNDATYDNGELRVFMTKRSKNEVLNVAEGYTRLPILMMDFTSVYSFRLYEVLKQKCFYPKGYPRDKMSYIFEFSISVAELKLLLGVVNSELDEVRRILNTSSGSVVDYEKAVERSPEKLYEEYKIFNRDVIRKAVNEVSKKSDQYVSYVGRRSGRERRVRYIEFKVYVKEYTDYPGKEEIIVEETKKPAREVGFTTEEIELLQFRACKLFPDFTFANVEVFLKDADYNMEKLEKAAAVFNESKKVMTINNAVGFVRKAIQDNFDMPITVNSRKTVNSFNDFEQRQYDDAFYEQLEMQLTE